MADQPNVGHILTKPAGKDAIHVAIAPVVSDERLYPAQHVGFNEDGTKIVSNPDKAIGIVDPYLTGPVPPGSIFYLFLYPKSTTSLRHEWTCPGFPDQGITQPSVDKAASEEWLREFIKTADCPPYEELIKAASGQELPIVDEVYGAWAYSNDGEYLYFGGRDAHGDIPPEFWDHVEIVTGLTIPNGKRAQYFSCSC